MVSNGFTNVAWKAKKISTTGPQPNSIISMIWVFNLLVVMHEHHSDPNILIFDRYIGSIKNLRGKNFYTEDSGTVGVSEVSEFKTEDTGLMTSSPLGSIVIPERSSFSAEGPQTLTSSDCSFKSASSLSSSLLAKMSEVGAVGKESSTDFPFCLFPMNCRSRGDWNADCEGSMKDETPSEDFDSLTS